MRILGMSLALFSIMTANAQTPTSPASAGPAATASEQPAPSAFVVKFKVKAGKNAEFEKAFREMQKAVASREPGNVYYDLYRIDQDPQTYVILEHYRDQAAVAAHRTSEHGKKLIAALGDLLEGRPEAMALVLVSSKPPP